MDDVLSMAAVYFWVNWRFFFFSVGPLMTNEGSLLRKDMSVCLFVLQVYTVPSRWCIYLFMQLLCTKSRPEFFENLGRYNYFTRFARGTT